MEVYLALAGKKEGPFTLFQIEEKILDHTANTKTLAWHLGCKKWAPLGELAPFKESFERLGEAPPEETAEETGDDEETGPEAVPGRGTATLPPVGSPDWESRIFPQGTVRPWVRFWARSLDQAFFFFLCIGALWFARSLGWVNTPYITVFGSYQLLTYPAWMIIEAYCLSRWAATPGKMLLRVHVTTEKGALLEFRTALQRSLSVLVMGLGCLLPIVTVITHIISFHILRKTGKTPWDRGLGTRVNHGGIGMVHILVPLGILFVLGIMFQGPLQEIQEASAEQIATLFRESRGNVEPEATGNP